MDPSNYEELSLADDYHTLPDLSNLQSQAIRLGSHLTKDSMQLYFNVRRRVNVYIYFSCEIELLEFDDNIAELGWGQTR